MIFPRLTSTPAPSSGEDETPTRHKSLSRTKEAIRRADRHINGLNARRPRPIGQPPKPLPDQGEEEETNIPDQRGYLPAPLPGDRVRRPSVQNLYMAAKTKLKLFEGTSQRLFTKQTTGTPPSFPANIK